MNKWISVDQQLPLMYESVLCYTNEGSICVAARHDYFGKPDFYCYDVKIEHVTHWLPLPDGPFASYDEG